jgi:hypothetical protein
MTVEKTWGELSDRLEALALKLKMHFEQTHDDEVPEALGRLRQGVTDAFDAASNAVKDDAVRTDVREVGQLFADLVGTAFARVEGDVRETFRRKG